MRHVLLANRKLMREFRSFWFIFICSQNWNQQIHWPIFGKRTNVAHSMTNSRKNASYRSFIPRIQVQFDIKRSCSDMNNWWKPSVDINHQIFDFSDPDFHRIQELKPYSQESSEFFKSFESLITLVWSEMNECPTKCNRTRIESLC